MTICIRIVNSHSLSRSLNFSLFPSLFPRFLSSLSCDYSLFSALFQYIPDIRLLQPHFSLSFHRLSHIPFALPSFNSCWIYRVFNSLSYLSLRLSLSLDHQISEFLIVRCFSFDRQLIFSPPLSLILSPDLFSDLPQSLLPTAFWFSYLLLVLSRRLSLPI